MENFTEKQLEDEWGPANAISPSEIINMLNLVKPKKSDVFYDLGSGHGRVVRMALTHGHVKQAIGIEHLEERFCRSRVIAKRTLSKKNLKKIDFFCGDMGDFDITNATIVYEDYSPFNEEYKMYRELFKNKRAKIIKRHLPLVGYLPVAAHRSKRGSWFFVMKTPLRKYRTKSKSKWISSILEDENVTMHQFYENLENRLKPFLEYKERKETIRDVQRLVRKYLPNE